MNKGLELGLQLMQPITFWLHQTSQNRCLLTLQSPHGLTSFLVLRPQALESRVQEPLQLLALVLQLVPLLLVLMELLQVEAYLL